MKWATRIIFVVAWLLWAIVAYKLLLPLQPPTNLDLIEEAHPTQYTGRINI